jgi:hypothetical protein
LPTPAYFIIGAETVTTVFNSADARNRKRTTQKAAWTTENLGTAVKCVTEDGKSIHRVAKDSVIP